MNRYEVACPGCSKTMRSADMGDLRGVLVRHIRNCVPMRKAAAQSLGQRRARRRAGAIFLLVAAVALAVVWLVLR